MIFFFLCKVLGEQIFQTPKTREVICRDREWFLASTTTSIKEDNYDLQKRQCSFLWFPNILRDQPNPRPVPDIIPRKRPRSPPQAARAPRPQPQSARGRRGRQGRRGFRGGSHMGDTYIRRSRRWKLQRVIEYDRLPKKKRSGAKKKFLQRHNIPKSTMSHWRKKKKHQYLCPQMIKWIRVNPYWLLAVDAEGIQILRTQRYERQRIISRTRRKGLSCAKEVWI